MSKAANAKDWRNLPVVEWNTTSFHDYLADEHKRRFGVDYAPFGTWQAEKGMLGRLIGTARKPGTHDKALVKRFIDACFDEYKPTAQWPGISFGFMWTYKKPVMQRLQAEALKSERSDTAAQNADNTNWEDLAEWL